MRDWRGNKAVIGDRVFYVSTEGAEVKALAEGFERAVSGEMPQPGVDSQEPGEGEPFGIGERPAGS